MKKKLITLSFLAATVAGTILSCKKKEPQPSATSESVSDDRMKSLAAEGGYTWYKNATETLATVQGSGHNPAMRVRFNQKAQSALNSDGKLPSGGSFPDESVIVKEVYSAQQGGTLKQTAIMYKKSDAKNAGNGWVWAEYNADGSNVAGAADKGSACTSCHSASGNRDMVRIFEAIP